MSKAQELMPCPFLGGTESFVERLDYSAAYVQCDSEVSPGVACMARGPVGVQESDDEDVPGSDAAIREWNRRTASSEQQSAQQDAERWRAFSQGAVFPKLAFNNGNSHWQYGEIRGLSANAVADLVIAARASNGGKAND